jgi:toxin YoeB
MQIEFSPQALKDFEKFAKSGNKELTNKITQLLESIQVDPYFGLGKPEPLKHHLSGMWSRRISREHRLVYELRDDIVYVLSVKGHYLD